MIRFYYWDLFSDPYRIFNYYMDSYAPFISYPCITEFSKLIYRIGCAMVSVLASSEVDRRFESRSGQTKDYKIGICCFSAKHAALRRKSKDWLLGIRITCPSGATCLPADCCFCGLVLKRSNSACWSSTKLTSSSSPWKLTCFHYDIAEKLLNWH